MKQHYTSIKVTVELYNLLNILKDQMKVNSKREVIEKILERNDQLVKKLNFLKELTKDKKE